VLNTGIGRLGRHPLGCETSGAVDDFVSVGEDEFLEHGPEHCACVDETADRAAGRRLVKLA